MKYSFTNQSDSISLKIYDTIGEDGWGNGVTTKDIEEQLGNGNLPLNIYINSYGGEVFEGFAIYNMLKRYSGYKTVYIDGIAASIASVIAMSGNKIIMNEASMMMIHNASGVCMGNAEEMQKVVNALEQMNEVIKDVYKARTNLDDARLVELMNNETFMSAKDCVELGFADEILPNKSEEDITNMMNSLKEMQNNIEKKIKMFNDIKELGFEAKTQVGGESVDEEESALNNKPHKWDWLRNGGMN
jgi:ATP-dependent protease ClpP protease subunit